MPEDIHKRVIKFASRAIYRGPGGHIEVDSQQALLAFEEIEALGEPSLDAVTMRLRHGTGREVGRLLAEVGKPALKYLEYALDNGDREEQAGAIRVLGAIGEPALELLKSVLWTSDDDQNRRWAAFELAKWGEKGMTVLSAAFEQGDDEVRGAAIGGLSGVVTAPERREETEEHEPMIELLTQALGDPCASVRLIAARALVRIRYLSMDAVEAALGDPDVEVRRQGLFALFDKGIDDQRSACLLAGVFEDPYRELSKLALDKMTSVPMFVSSEEVNYELIADTVIDELVVRGPDRLDEHFNPALVVQVLRRTVERNPRILGRALKRLCDLAHQHDDAVRLRAVSIGRALNPDEFILLIKGRSDQDPAATRAIMRLLGGNEAIAFFSSEERDALARYREPLEDLEDISRKRWEELTAQARRGFNVSLGLSIALFVVGAGIVIWGLILLTVSNDLAEQIAGGTLAAISGVATTLSSKFWKEPVEHIKSFSAQQARVQAAFIGYMNRVAQIRLAFEHHYTTSGICVDELDTYQKALSDAIDQATRQLGDEIHD